jgi:LmbE family N-acetylglucosaminyl deacetylase
LSCSHPHPDDDVIGCGGSLLKYRAAGAEVSVIYLTSGDAGARQLRREEIGAIREEEARAAAAMNIKDLTFLRLPDGLLSSRADAVPRLVSLVRDARPDVVYLPHAADGPPAGRTRKPADTATRGHRQRTRP